MYDFWVKQANRYLAAWQRAYGLDGDQARLICKALARALEKENHNGRRAERTKNRPSNKGLEPTAPACSTSTDAPTGEAH
jgi:hypothetical protein